MGVKIFKKKPNSIGSRDFNGTTDRIDWASPYDFTDEPITISCWIKSDGVSGALDIFWAKATANNEATGIIFYASSNFGLWFQRGSALYKGVNSSPTLANTWRNVLATHDGTMTNYTTIKIYLEGTEQTSIAGNSNGTTDPTQTGTLSIGGYLINDSFSFDGKIAQVGVWSRVLTSTEITNLASGYAPSLAAPSDLKFYFKGNTSNLYNSVAGGAEGTADGTTQLIGAGNGPEIIYS